MSGKIADDCFALPGGIRWTPVDEALATLRARLQPVIATVNLPIDGAQGRVLAEPVVAARANPATANAAVDGYGFAFASLAGQTGAPTLRLTEGRAAAGVPFGDTVRPGRALRILTGAVLPEGVDTVVLQEDVTRDGRHIRFSPGLKPGANCRAAGEDVGQGAIALAGGRKLRPQDIALATALGVSEARVHKRLRVAVLSTGDEIITPGAIAARHQMFDANRPMLAAILSAWGYDVIDLGCAPDDRDAVRAHLRRGAARADAVLTTGGASDGDEDHMASVLRDEGALQTWRIAMKPGRPMALANLNGVPVFGLPGNPVAAFVCALIFARPALSVLAGAGWSEPLGVAVPAGFTKTKKAGRREYLRARLNQEGRAEVFTSEGSGRISGLSWADGLVELPDAAGQTLPGDPVRYLPFAGFGL